MRKYRLPYFVAALLSSLGLVVACNSEFNKVVPDSGVTGGIDYAVPKLLYIVADGARGTSIRDAATPNIKALIPSSIYSWTSLADGKDNDATNWADMITGVKKEKHNVQDNSFAGNNLQKYPSIFERIKSLRPQMRIAAFTSSDLLKEKLTGGADVAESFSGNDDALKTRLLSFLKTDDAPLIFAEFGAISKAGMASGFDLSFPAYSSAIENFDTQIGEVMAALKARPNYSKEKWLIILTSNKGGAYTLPVLQDDKTIFSNTVMNTFTIFSAEGAFKQTFINKPFVGTVFTGKSFRIKGDPDRVRAALPIPTDGSENKNLAFNFGVKDFTISLKVRKLKNPRDASRGDYYYNFPSLVSKRKDNSNGILGWSIGLRNNGWRFYGAGGDGATGGEEIAGRDISGEVWHDLTVVVERKADGIRYMRMYTDGLPGITNKNNGSVGSPFTGEYRIAGTPMYDNADALNIGYLPGLLESTGNLNVNIAELKIWNVALPDNVVRQYACDLTMQRSHPNYGDLLGYWPMAEGSGSVLTDKGPYGAHFTIQSTTPLVWDNFQGLMCSPSSSNLSALVPKNSDIPAQILSWFNIVRQESWGLDGRVWISN